MSTLYEENSLMDFRKDGAQFRKICLYAHSGGFFAPYIFHIQGGSVFFHSRHLNNPGTRKVVAAAFCFRFLVGKKEDTRIKVSTAG